MKPVNSNVGKELRCEEHRHLIISYLALTSSVSFMLEESILGADFDP